MIKFSRIPIFTVCAAMLICLAATLTSCNAQKKNTAAARQYTAFITRYNIMYNGDTHYDETLKNMQDKYEDDYTAMLRMHPVEAKGVDNAPQPSGDFKRSIEKAQKAIQIRSIKKKPEKKNGKGNDPEYKAWMKRDEYNPYLHNAWMLLGRSQYYNGDFLGAASTFYYVSKHFTWLPNTVTEAKLWQALSYISMDWLYEGEVIVTRIKPEELDTKSLKNLYNYVYADFLVKSKDYTAAIPYLKEAIDGAKGQQKTRLTFLLGQLYAATDQRELAYQAFKKAGQSPSVPYRTKVNARIKQSEVYTGTNIEPEVKSLRNMTRYDRNKDYLDQIYYAIGNLYLSRQDTASAIANYELAVDKSTRQGIEKAITQVSLGSLYFDLGNYEKAQPNYSEAISQLPKTYPGYPMLKRRADVLDELAVYSENVNLQDSLLHLASLPEDQQLAVIDKIIEDLKKKEKEAAEEAAREEYLAQVSANESKLIDKDQREFTMNADNSWYFYNPTSKNSGKAQFQKRWGSRKLEDDWRRRNKTVFNTSDFDNNADDELADDGAAAQPNDSLTDEQKAVLEAENDPHKREYYLKQLPKTEDEIATSNEIIQDGLYNMGVILKDKLDDNKAALAEFGRLLNDYPDNVYRLDVYYNLYLMYVREGNTAEAERYRNMILSDFADSKYGVALKDPHYIDNLRNMDARQGVLYEQTYDDYINNRNQAVHHAYDTMMELYPLSPIMPKFMFLDALAYVTENKPDEFNAVLRDMLERYPQTDIAPIASAWLKGMAQGRQLHASADGTNMRGLLWDIHLSNDSTRVGSDSIPAFEINEEVPHLLVMVFATDEVPANALLYEVARHNFNSFVVKDFDLELMNFGRLGMLVIKGFDNMRELNHYRTVMAASDDFRMPRGVSPVVISEQNFQTLLNEGRTFDDYFRFLQEHNYVDPQADLLAPDEIETLQEAEEAAAGTPDDDDGYAELVIEDIEPVLTDIADKPVDSETPTPAAETEAVTAVETVTLAPENEVPAETAKGVTGTVSEPKEQPKTADAPAQSDKPAGTSKPAAKTQPVKSTPIIVKKTVPDNPEGSEGDDPLLDY